MRWYLKAARDTDFPPPSSAPPAPAAPKPAPAPSLPGVSDFFSNSSHMRRWVIITKGLQFREVGFPPQLLTTITVVLIATVPTVTSFYYTCIFPFLVFLSPKTQVCDPKKYQWLYPTLFSSSKWEILGRPKGLAIP